MEAAVSNKAFKLSFNFSSRFCLGDDNFPCVRKSNYGEINYDGKIIYQQELKRWIENH
jgi:hypothetical protein